jgi:multidrug efflux pump subunit AcrB
VASANSILLVTFAKEQRAHRLSALEAASAAGRTRLRPILMTSLAMVIGMLPMALGLGDGGEQNAPLGRAVIGGLLMARRNSVLGPLAVQPPAQARGRAAEGVRRCLT